MNLPVPGSYHRARLSERPLDFSNGRPAYPNSTPAPLVVAAVFSGPVVCLTILPKLSYCRCSTTFPRSEAFPDTMSRTESW